MFRNRFDVRAVFRTLVLGATVAGAFVVTTGSPASAQVRPTRPFGPVSAGRRPCRTPEIDAVALRGLLAFVSGAVLVLSDRRRS
jgi:hypothetical protein